MDPNNSTVIADPVCTQDQPSVPDNMPPIDPEFLKMMTTPKPDSFFELADADTSSCQDICALLYAHDLLPELTLKKSAWYLEPTLPISQEEVNTLCQRASNFLKQDITLSCLPDSRDSAINALYNAMCDSGLCVISKSFETDMLEIPYGETWVAPPGKTIALYVNGVQRELTSGTYSGVVSVVLSDEILLKHMVGAKHRNSAALWVNGEAESEVFAPMAQLQGGLHPGILTDVSLISNGNDFNGIVIGKNTGYTVRNAFIKMDGYGKNDFAGSGAAFLTTENSDVVLDHAVITCRGALRSCIAARGDSKLLVKDSLICGENGSNMDFETPTMKEVPWVLGIRGNLRATNVLECADVTYLNSRVYSEGWGVLSTDSCDCKLTVINTSAAITGNSGYGMYVSNEAPSRIYGSGLYGATYGAVISGETCGAVVGAATEQHVGPQYYQMLPENRRDACSQIYANRFCFMWHGNKGGLLDIDEGTVLNAGDTVFLIKSSDEERNRCYPVIHARKCNIISKRGIIAHMMQSDDPGMGTGKTGTPEMWAPEYVVPSVVHGAYSAAVETENSTTTVLEFQDMELTGDIYNSVWKHPQNMMVTLSGGRYAGAISAATATHTNVLPGGCIRRENREELGNMSVTASPVAQNGMIVVLKDGAVWRPEESWISSFTMDKGCKLVGKLLLNGEELTPIAGQTIKGPLHILPE